MNNSLWCGLLIIPSSISLFIARPIDIQHCENPWTKLTVPSIGSIIHVGASVNSNGSFLLCDSSAINL